MWYERNIETIAGEKRTVNAEALSVLPPDNTWHHTEWVISLHQSILITRSTSHTKRNDAIRIDHVNILDISVRHRNSTHCRQAWKGTSERLRWERQLCPRTTSEVHPNGDRACATPWRDVRALVLKITQHRQQWKPDLVELRFTKTKYY